MSHVRNASKFTPIGQRIRLSVAANSSTNETTRHSGWLSHGAVMFFAFLRGGDDHRAVGNNDQRQRSGGGF